MNLVDIMNTQDASRMKFIRRMRSKAQSLARITELENWVTDIYTGHFLSKLAHKKDCLDVGTFTGFSAACMAISGNIVYTYDVIDQPSKVWESYPTLSKIIQLPITTSLAPVDDMFFDLIYIDAEHNVGIFQDMAYYTQRLNPGGIIVCHDCCFDGVYYAVSQYTDLFIQTPKDPLSHQRRLGIYLKN